MKWSYGLIENITCRSRWFVAQNHLERRGQKLFGKRAGTLKKYLAGDKTNHLSITIYHRLTSSDRINGARALRQWSQLVKSDSYQEETKPSFPSRQAISAVLCSPFLEKKKTLSSSDITQGIAGKRLEEPPLLYSNQQSHLNHTCSCQSVSKEVWWKSVVCSATSTE